MVEFPDLHGGNHLDKTATDEMAGGVGERGGSLGVVVAVISVFPRSPLALDRAAKNNNSWLGISETSKVRPGVVARKTWEKGMSSLYRQ